NIQVQGLAKRLEATATERAVIGLSGGLDSTQAAIVAARAMDRLGRPRANVLAYTLPGFATSEHTKANAWALIRALGLTGAEIEISPELVPASAGVIQSTEQAIGPYVLQDFNLYYVTRYGFRPSKIAFLAHHAWSDADRGSWPPNIPAAKRRAYPLSEIKHWL